MTQDVWYVLWTQLCFFHESKRPSRACMLELSFVDCLMSQQHASVSQGQICSDKFMSCHTEIDVADPTFHLTQSQYTDTGLTSLSADPITPGAWQGSHWSANFEVTGMTRAWKNCGASRIQNPGSFALEADALTTRPMRRCMLETVCSVVRGLQEVLTCTL